MYENIKIYILLEWQYIWPRIIESTRRQQIDNYWSNMLWVEATNHFIRMNLPTINNNCFARGMVLYEDCVRRRIHDLK